MSITTSYVGGFIIEDPNNDIDNNIQSKSKNQNNKNKSKQKNQSTDTSSKRGDLNKNSSNESFEKKKDHKKQDQNRIKNDTKSSNDVNIEDSVSGNDGNNLKGGSKSSALDPAFKMRNKEVQPAILGLGKFVVSPDDNQQVNSQNIKVIKQNNNNNIDKDNNKLNKKGKNRNEISEFDSNNNNNNNKPPNPPTSNNSRIVSIAPPQMKGCFIIEDPLSDNTKQVNFRSNNQSNNNNNNNNGNDNNHYNQPTRVTKKNYGKPDTYLVVNPKCPTTEKKDEDINRGAPTLPKEYKGLRRDAPIIKPHFSSQNHNSLPPYQNNKKNPPLKVNSRFNANIEGSNNKSGNNNNNNRNPDPYSLYPKPNTPSSPPNKDPYSLYPKPPPSDSNQTINSDGNHLYPQSSSNLIQSNPLPVPPIVAPVIIVEKNIVETKSIIDPPPAPIITATKPVLSLIPPATVESISKPKIVTPTVRTPIFKKSASINWADDDSDD